MWIDIIYYIYAITCNHRARGRRTEGVVIITDIDSTRCVIIISLKKKPLLTSDALRRRFSCTLFPLQVLYLTTICFINLWFTLMLGSIGIYIYIYIIIYKLYVTFQKIYISKIKWKCNVSCCYSLIIWKTMKLSSLPIKSPNCENVLNHLHPVFSTVGEAS